MRYLPISEVVKHVNISRDTVHRRIRAGLLAAEDISTNERPRFRITDEALDAYLETRPWERAAS